MKSLVGSLLLFSSISFGQTWNSNLEDAFDIAKSSDRPVLIFFSVSESCDSCRKLDRVVFQSPDFSEFASKELVLVKMDFAKPVDSFTNTENLLIVEKYNKDGFFPWVVLVDKYRKVIGKAALYENQSPVEYLNEIKKIIRS